MTAKTTTKATDAVPSAATSTPKPILKRRLAADAASTHPNPATKKARSKPQPAKKAKASDGTALPVTHAARAASTSTPNAVGDAVVLGGIPATIQIIAGAYDRTLHGVTASVVAKADGTDGADRADAAAGAEVLQFADTFLFNAHTSALRCLALSPPSVPVPGQGQKLMLATGSTDERINIYHLSAHPETRASVDGAEERALLASLGRAGGAGGDSVVIGTAENAKNRELGTLLHHSATVTRLVFPTRSKLLSASEDSTVAVTRTRDWSLLSTVRAPVPKAGTGASAPRPSGDTAPPGGAPSGINDFAVHPSMKVMISVSRGERCMRLWNLVTGKKAGVLNFDRDLLRDVGEGRFATGEGRQVVWGRSFGGGDGDDTSSDEYAIGFDRNVVVFGMDSLPRCKVLGDTRTKTHGFHYLEVDAADAADASGPANADKTFSLLAVATEDGRILLCSTRLADLVTPPPAVSNATVTARKGAEPATPLPCARLVGVLGGAAAGVTGRVKAFKVLTTLETVASNGSSGNGSAKSSKKHTRLQKVWYVVTASSTGALRVWRLTGKELRTAWTDSRPVFASSGGSGATAGSDKDSKSSKEGSALPAPRQLGQLLGMYQTQDRITCLEAFVMIPRPEGLEDSEDEEGDEDELDEEDDDDE